MNTYLKECVPNISGGDIDNIGVSCEEGPGAVLKILKSNLAVLGVGCPALAIASAMNVRMVHCSKRCEKLKNDGKGLNANESPCLYLGKIEYRVNDAGRRIDS